MKICQQLYENGFITYIRTDSISYSNEFISFIRNFILKEYNNEKYVRNIISVNENAHEPIRPTNMNIRNLSLDLSVKERKIYKIIWETTLESCMTSSIYDSMNISLSAPIDLKYTKNIRNMIFDGWEKVKGYNNSKEEKEYNYLLHLKNDITIPYKKIKAMTSYTDTHPCYTETLLLNKLKDYGIGRPSTYSSLIDKIQERKYVIKEDISTNLEYNIYELVNDVIEKSKENKEKIEKNRLIIQPIGILVIEYLYNNYSHIFNYNYTKEMEKKLDDILNENNNLFNVCDECCKMINK
jgi:DNA topoisomerase-1